MKRLAAAAIVGLLLLLAAGPATAQTDSEETEPSRTTSTTYPDTVGIQSGWSFHDAVITTPGEPMRLFDAYHAATFVQSWLPWLYFGQPAAETPPEGVPVSRVDVTGNWGDRVGTVSVYFATDGTKAWLSYPQGGQTNDPADPPPPNNWQTVPAHVIATFNGTAELDEDTAGRAELTQPNRYKPTSTSAPSSSSSSWVWLVVAVGVVVVIGLLVAPRRRALAEPEAKEPVPTARG